MFYSKYIYWAQEIRTYNKIVFIGGVHIRMLTRGENKVSCYMRSKSESESDGVRSWLKAEVC